MSLFKYELPVYLDGFQTQKDINTSAKIPDAREAIWAIYDLNYTELVGVITVVDAATIRITCSPALAEGNYQLLGIA